MRAARSAAMVCGVGLGLVVLLIAPGRTDATPSADEVLLSDPGADWALVSETPGRLDSLSRLYESELGHLLLSVTPVTDPPGVDTMFDLVMDANVGFDIVPEPSLGLGVWLVEPGSEVGAGGFSALMFASRQHVFNFSVSTASSAAIDGPTFLLDLAERQIAQAGGQPAPAEAADPDRSEAEAELVTFLPDTPAGFDLSVGDGDRDGRARGCRGPRRRGRRVPQQPVPFRDPGMDRWHPGPHRCRQHHPLPVRHHRRRALGHRRRRNGCRDRVDGRTFPTSRMSSPTSARAMRTTRSGRRFDAATCS